MRIRLAMLAAAAALATFAGAGRASAMGPPLSIPNQLESALALDKSAHTVTLPLYEGVSHGQRVWSVPPGAFVPQKDRYTPSANNRILREV